MAFEQNYVSGAVSLLTNQSLLLEVIVLGSLISKYGRQSSHQRNINEENEDLYHTHHYHILSS